MRRFWMGGICALIGLLFLGCGQAMGSLFVGEWLLSVGTLDFEHSQYSTHSITQVANPFQTTDTTSLPAGSYSTASYDISWLLGEAHFNITTTHHWRSWMARRLLKVAFYSTPSVDSLVDLSGNLQYAWPGAAIGTALIGMDILDVTDPDNQILVAGDAVVDGNFPIGQPFGSFNIGDNGIIQSGRQYLLSYVAQVRHFDPTPPGTFGEASGDFHFTIAPIPEPAAALLLVLPFLAKRSRRLR